MHYGASTRLRPDVVMSKAAEYFASLGLEAVRRSPSTLTMESAKGQVAITVSLGSETEVDIVTHGYNRRSKPSSKGSDECMVENARPRSDAPPVVEEGKEYKLKIVDMGKQGDGIARMQGLVIFVPGAKPGEEIDVRIKKVGRNCAFGEKVVKEGSESTS